MKFLVYVTLQKRKKKNVSPYIISRFLHIVIVSDQSRVDLWISFASTRKLLNLFYVMFAHDQIRCVLISDLIFKCKKISSRNTTLVHFTSSSPQGRNGFPDTKWVARVFSIQSHRFVSLTHSPIPNAFFRSLPHWWLCLLSSSMARTRVDWLNLLRSFTKFVLWRNSH